MIDRVSEPARRGQLLAICFNPIFVNDKVVDVEVAHEIANLLNVDFWACGDPDELVHKELDEAIESHLDMLNESRPEYLMPKTVRVSGYRRMTIEDALGHARTAPPESWACERAHDVEINVESGLAVDLIGRPVSIGPMTTNITQHS
jgi:hypothetical protein